MLIGKKQETWNRYRTSIKNSAKEDVTMLETSNGEVTEDEGEIAQKMNKGLYTVVVREDYSQLTPIKES